MKSSIEILDAIAVRIGAATARFKDARIAEAMGINQSVISNIRAGRKRLANSDCKRAAAVLKVDPAILITIVAAEREDDADLKKSLYKLAQRSIPAVVALALSLGSSGSYSPPAGASGSGLYIMLNTPYRRRRTERRRRSVRPFRTTRLLTMAPPICTTV